MSTRLPQDLQTAKVKSLDGDLKKIAEELIAEKFGVKEEVKREKSRDFFRQEFPGYPGRHDESIYGFRGATTATANGDTLVGGPSIEIVDDYATRSRMARLKVGTPSFGALLGGVEQLDRKFPSRGQRSIYAGTGFLKRLSHDPSFAKNVAYKSDWHPKEGIDNPVAQIYGMKVYVMQDRYFDDHCYIQQSS